VLRLLLLPVSKRLRIVTLLILGVLLRVWRLPGSDALKTALQSRSTSDVSCVNCEHGSCTKGRVAHWQGRVALQLQGSKQAVTDCRLAPHIPIQVWNCSVFSFLPSVSTTSLHSRAAKLAHFEQTGAARSRCSKEMS
jgi:hypothetical protein